MFYCFTMLINYSNYTFSWSTTPKCQSFIHSNKWNQQLCQSSIWVQLMCFSPCENSACSL